MVLILNTKFEFQGPHSQFSSTIKVIQNQRLHKSSLNMNIGVSTAPGPGPGPLQSNIASVQSQNLFLHRTRSMCSICSVVFVYFTYTTLHIRHKKSNWHYC